MVVVLHSITIGLSEHTYTNGLWIYYLGVFAIPLFFMTNGYLQLGKINQYRYVFQKVFRIMIIVLFWGGLLYLVKWVIGDTVTNPFYEIFGSFLQKGGFPHFWFLGSILIIDLLLPLFQKTISTAVFFFLGVFHDGIVCYFRYSISYFISQLSICFKESYHSNVSFMDLVFVFPFRRIS